MNLEVELIAGVVKGGPPPKNLPAPRLIKIFIAGERNEFIEERKQLLELVGPELQSIYDDMGIEVLLVDMQYATNVNPDRNPFLAEYFLDEIHAAYQHSRGCFLLEYYERDSDCYVLKAGRLGTAKDSWHSCEPAIREALKKAAESAISEKCDNEEIRNILKSTAERQLEHALKLDETGEGVIAVTRSWKGKKSPKAVASLKSLVNSRLPIENVINVEVEQKTGGINPENKTHKGYLAHICRLVVNRVQTLVNASIEADPEIKSKKKMVQEVYAESLMHLALLREIKPSEDNEHIERIKEMLIAGKTQKHNPIVIKGSKYSGKSSLLSRIYTDVSSWLDSATFKVVRLCASTPRSAYRLELLRVLCQHVGFLAGLLDGNLPKDASFDPLYVNNWLGQIMRRIEEEPMKEQLVIFLDDLHRLHSLDCDMHAALSGLPWNLPPGVHLVVTTLVNPELQRLTPLQKERQKEILLEPPDSVSTVPEKSLPSSQIFDTLKSLIGERAANRIGAILASTEYGLSETEILEVIMPTGGDGPLFLDEGQFNFATWCLVRRTLSEYLKVRVMSGRLLFSWRYPIRDLACKRYFPDQKTLKSYHGELANLFFSEDFEDKDDKPPPEEETPKKETPFQSRPRSQDTAYNLRHVEEAWLTLLRAGDVEKLKKLAVCAFDFLLAAVQMISVSYLRCVLEYSRKYLLERDLELVYYTVRKSSDILTRDPLQLGAQLICWLRPVAEDGGDLVNFSFKVSRMVTAAMAWCDGYTAPLLVPLNGWLQPPLPLQIRNLVCSPSVNLVEPTPSGQHVIVVPFQEDAQLWHVMSGQLVHTFTGHTSPISCLAVMQHSQYLLTGSKDTSIIVWDLKNLTLKLKIQEHIAPVLCLTSALKNSVIVSGGEDARIIVTSLTGDVHIKVDHHRGPVNSICVDSAGEILVSGSSDRTVCLWCLVKFELLKSIVLPTAVTMLDVSSDSMFLLVACKDQKLYLRSLATGTEIHTLRGHQGDVKSICLAKDCRRAIAGGVKGRVSVFDTHSGRLTKNLLANPSMDVTAVKVTEKDDFLITGCGNQVIYWSFRGEDPHFKPQKSSRQKSLHPHTAPISCLDISRDGVMAVTGGVDSLVNLWQLNTHELLSTFEGHIASVTCIAFSASGLFVASGSEDKTVRVWGLTLGLVVATVKHQAPVTAVTAMLDGRRIVSSDRSGVIRIWAADTGVLIQSICVPGRCFTVSADMRFAVCGTGDNQLRIVHLGVGRKEMYQVYHSQEITCLVVTPDSRSLITGSKDSLKVWRLPGGLLSQALVGHTDHVTCVAVSVLDKSIVVSGSRDANLIVWDINTGNDLHTLKGHLDCITCVKLSGDGSLAASGSEDKSLIVWDTKKGCSLSSIMLHVPILGMEMATDLSRIALHLLEQKCMPILCLHNTPAEYVKLPYYVAPLCDTTWTEPGPKRPHKRLLKKEVSLDSDTWRRKYGHLTSGMLTSSVEDGLQRRFSVSASMDEISKVGLTSSPSIGPEQAALAQLQHFNQLEALWNKESPPARPRGHGRTLSKQSSLQATLLFDSEEEGEYLEEEVT
ncbi:PREDICTED: NACHT domain- and WD repeat-containing protein 1 [Habropoda laboriosa]|uniref:NACHT domain- and WD repeat-containing protein 1 n=1 Tax=Habropoda laboriosa TaxID=597456 RepID=UPI00083CF4CA|nr:PREDICTED: NACHT domain- and WD repeat-containing protein 1 [Habropoda laboriosa]